MHKKEYPQINETVFTEVLPNGLTVTLIPKNDFHKTYGLFTTQYGSIDNHFVPIESQNWITVPDGIAHFLEHKMFEKKTGDVFQIFGKQGASANAFTSFTRTSYLFSSTEAILENLRTLIDFVQDPYFTEETVEKEKGIIGQEIQMYQDEPDWRLFFGIIQNLYPKHPIHIDIAGTIDSIAEITADDLYTCYHTFYHPSNMNLLVVGKMDVDVVMNMIKANQANKKFAKAKPIQRSFPVENVSEIVAESSIEMPIAKPKAALGIKKVGDLPTDEFAKQKESIVMDLLLQLLIGETSDNYLKLYNEGLLDDTFGFEFNLERSFSFADLSGDSNQPKALINALKEILLQGENSPELTEERLVLLKRKMVGQFYQQLNSLEYIANQYSQLTPNASVSLFDRPDIIQSVTLEDIKQAATEFLVAERMSEFYIYPKGDGPK